MEDIYWVAKISNIYLGYLKFLIFFFFLGGGVMLGISDFIKK